MIIKKQTGCGVVLLHQIPTEWNLNIGKGKKSVVLLWKKASKHADSCRCLPVSWTSRWRRSFFWSQTATSTTESYNSAIVVPVNLMIKCNKLKEKKKNNPYHYLILVPRYTSAYLCNSTRRIVSARVKVVLAVSPEHDDVRAERADSGARSFTLQIRKETVKGSWECDSNLL